MCFKEGEKMKEEKRPEVDPSAFVADDADILGDVHIGRNCSIWYHCVIRGDRAPVYIGEGSNVQDLCLIHMDYNLPVRIGRFVTIGHGAIVHGAQIGDHSLIGMGAILMNGCKIGAGCIVGAGALVTQNVVIPDNSMVVGAPAKVIRQVTEEELAHFEKNNTSYIEEAARCRENPPVKWRKD